MNTQKDTSPQVSEEAKSGVIKALAIIGLIAVIVIGLWIAVQVIRVIPSAFSSLASIADSVYNEDEPFVTTSVKNVVNTDEPLLIRWPSVNVPGVYTFTYRCVDGVSAEARTVDGDIVSVECESPFTLNPEAEEAEVIFAAEKKRFTDVLYSVTFTPENTELASKGDENLITIVNASITQSSERVDDDGTEMADTPVAATRPTSPSTPAVISSTPVPVTTTRIPVSDPNGTTDLVISYLGLGSLSGNTFTPSGTIDNDTKGAVRFAVKNAGTKTSGKWTFRTELPDEAGTTYRSPDQEPLKPNERAILTVGFENLGSPRTDTVEVSISGGNDTVTTNNSFEWSVKIVE